MLSLKMLCPLVIACLLVLPAQSQVLDEVTRKNTLERRQVLAYPSIREADILWEKRIWREIDSRQLMNLYFRYPGGSLFEVLMKGIQQGDIKSYSPENDKFAVPMDVAELNGSLNSSDTVEIMDPETYEIRYEVVSNDFNPEDIIKYRIKEVWFFDTKYSTLRVRILGIAPIQKVFDDNGNEKFEKPLFWIYYPHCREYLARHQAFLPGNDIAVISWEDQLERRFFDSYIVKENNVHDRRIQDYAAGRDALLESDRIKREIFNYEHDLWSY